MKKKWIALLLAAMMVLSLLAGCGAGSAASSAEPAASAASAETEQAAGTETEPAEAPQAEEPAEAASAEEPAAEEPAEEGYVPRINFPGAHKSSLFHHRAAGFKPDFLRFDFKRKPYPAFLILHFCHFLSRWQAGSRSARGCRRNLRHLL